MWKDVIGNLEQIEILKSYIASGRIPHALLFSGIKGIGKSLIALEFFKAANCLNSKGDACDKCSSCIKANANVHPDLKYLNPEGMWIKVDNVRALIEDLSLKPFEARMRVVIIEPAERLNDEGANALLKTLEEPSASTIIILVSHNSNQLIPTVFSRCQMIRFNPLDKASTKNIDPSIVNLTSGTIGGIASADITLITKFREGVLKILKGGNPFTLEELVAKKIDNRDSYYIILSVFESFLRDIYSINLGNTELINEELKGMSIRNLPYFELEQITQSLTSMRSAFYNNISLRPAFAEFGLKLSALASS